VESDRAGGELGIGELARRSGLPVSALRFYDGAGVLVPAAVDPRTGYRRYAPAQVRAARLLARLRRVGMPLADLRAVLSGTDPGPVLDAHLRRLEDGLADARRELSAVRALLSPEVPVRMTLDARPLAAALDAVRFAAGTDPERPVLAGVLLDPDGDGLCLVATDRYRLAVAPLPATTATAPVLLPLALVDELRPLLDARPAAPATDADLVTIAAEGDQVRVTVGGRTLRGTRPEGDYPGWRRIVRDLGGRPVTLAGEPFRAALAAAPTERRDDDGRSYDLVVLTLTGDGALQVAGDGDGLQVAVNRDFLLDAVGGADQLVLELDSPITPLAVRIPATAAYSLLMPVRLPA
jgi:DNA-binding transcriptional MerR regulator